MKIPSPLPKFERNAALFITAGEYEAHFYIAQKGELRLEKKFKMPPREEAKEKQGFIGRRAARPSLSSVGHKGRYVLDLKMKFSKEIHRYIHDIIATYKLKEIYVFAPRYVAKRIESKLNKPELAKIRMKFYSEYTKMSPLKMLEIFAQEESKATKKENALLGGAFLKILF